VTVLFRISSVPAVGPTRRIISILWLSIAVSMGVLVSRPAAAGAGTPRDTAAADLAAAAPESTMLVILPLANRTGRLRALEIGQRFISAALDSMRMPYLDSGEARPLLREYRIRAIGQIDRRGAHLIREKLGARWLLLGSIDVFRESQPPEYGLSLRLVDPVTLLVLAATSVGHSGRDYEGLFGQGERQDVVRVARETVREAVLGLWEGLSQSVVRDVRPTSLPRICIVPFDGTEKSWRDGQTVSDLMLTSLVQAGYPCLEPGVVRRALLGQGYAFKGEVDGPSLDHLAREDSVVYLITGTAELFEPARGESRAAVPRVSLSARILDARRGRLLDAWFDERTGKNGETLFERGRTYSLIGLTLKSLRGFVERIEKVRRDVAEES